MILTVPGLTAVTSPDDASTVATSTLPELHTPPGFPVVVYVEVLPGQSGEAPFITPALAFGLTVTMAEAGTALQPVTVYMILAFPELTAVTNPVTGLTVATSGLLLLQVPPASPLLLYKAVEPIHNGELPVTVPETASGLTVSCLNAEAGLLQPDVTV